MIKKTIILFLFFCISFNIFSQEKYWIFFTDKKDVQFNPYEYFDKKAIERRIINDFPLNHITDFPLKKSYVKSVSEIVDEVISETRWFNAVAVWTNSEQISKLKKMDFVKSVQRISLRTHLTSYKDYGTNLKENQEELLKAQTLRMGGDLFDKHKINGKGVRIAIFDGGFPSVDTSPAFEHIRKNNRIIKTYNFPKKEENVYGFNAHGTMVMSCIAGIINGQKMGLATESEFLLARTEVNSEPFSEEENWLAAVEWADKNGAQIINSSLGYTNDRYFPEDMNGTKSLVVKAANLAARKGILVVNAMGNDGSGKWKFMGTPADADSILSIGGTNPWTDMHTNFSSYGPTADKRRKPNVSAYGHVIAAGKSKLVSTQGTSFSSPLVAGFASCVLQKNPKLKVMDLMKEVEKSGELYPYYDYAHGYGVPQASYFFEKNNNKFEETFDTKIENDTLFVIIKDNYFKPDYKGLIEIRLFSDFDNFDKLSNTISLKHYLYFHVENEKSYLDNYKIIRVYKKDAFAIPIKELGKNKTVRIHYKKYTKELKF